MKKWIYLVLIMISPLLGLAFMSCDDDKDLPDVSISLDVTQGTVVDGTIYIAQGDTIKVGAISVVNNDKNKGAGITNVNYYWDGMYYAPSVFAPYGMIFPTTESTPVGNHSIDISCTVLAVDKSIATAALSYPVIVVASEDQIPSGDNNSEIVNTTNLK